MENRDNGVPGERRILGIRALLACSSELALLAPARGGVNHTVRSEQVFTCPSALISAPQPSWGGPAAAWAGVLWAAPSCTTAPRAHSERQTAPPAVPAFRSWY